jgi:hypothetical protein
MRGFAAAGTPGHGRSGWSEPCVSRDLQGLLALAVEIPHDISRRPPERFPQRLFVGKNNGDLA